MAATSRGVERYIRVRVDASDALRSVQRIDRNVETATNRLAGMGRALNLLVFSEIAQAGFQITQVLTEWADASQDLTARLNAAAGGVAAGNDVYERLLELSLALGANVDDLGAAFTKLKVSIDPSIASTNEIITGLGEVSRILATTGATTQQTNAVLLQLSQALSSNALQGDEFRSVYENAPVLLQAWREAIGRTDTSLRDLSASAELTTASFFENIDVIGELASEMVGASEPPLTVARAMTNMRTAFLDAFRDLGDGRESPFSQTVDVLNEMAASIVENSESLYILISALDTAIANFLRLFSILNDGLTLLGKFAKGAANALSGGSVATERVELLTRLRQSNEELALLESQVAQAVADNPAFADSAKYRNAQAAIEEYKTAIESMSQQLTVASKADAVHARFITDKYRETEKSTPVTDKATETTGEYTKASKAAARADKDQEKALADLQRRQEQAAALQERGIQNIRAGIEVQRQALVLQQLEGEELIRQEQTFKINNELNARNLEILAAQRAGEIEKARALQAVNAELEKQRDTIIDLEVQFFKAENAATTWIDSLRDAFAGESQSIFRSLFSGGEIEFDKFLQSIVSKLGQTLGASGGQFLGGITGSLGAALLPGIGAGIGAGAGSLISGGISSLFGGGGDGFQQMKAVFSFIDGELSANASRLGQNASAFSDLMRGYGEIFDSVIATYDENTQQLVRALDYTTDRSSASSLEEFGNKLNQVFWQIINAAEASGSDWSALLQRLWYEAQGDIDQFVEEVNGLQVLFGQLSAAADDLQGEGTLTSLEQFAGILKDMSEIELAEATIAISNLAGLVESLKTDSAKLIEATIAVESVFSELGIAIPESAEGFLMLVESLDLTTASGIAAAAALGEIADDIDLYYENLARRAEEAAEEARRAEDEALRSAQEQQRAFERQQRSAEQAMLDLLASYRDAIIDVSERLAESRQSIEEFGMTEEELYNRRREEAEQLAEELETTTDPARIQEIVREIQGLVGDAWGLLTDDQREKLQGEFITYIDRIAEVATRQLAIGLDEAVDTYEDAYGPLSEEMRQIVGEFNEVFHRVWTGLEDAGLDLTESEQALSQALDTLSINVDEAGNSLVDGANQIEGAAQAEAAAVNQLGTYVLWFGHRVEWFGHRVLSFQERVGWFGWRVHQFGEHVSKFGSGAQRIYDAGARFMAAAGKLEQAANKMSNARVTVQVNVSGGGGGYGAGTMHWGEIR